MLDEAVWVLFQLNGALNGSPRLVAFPKPNPPAKRSEAWETAIPTIKNF